MQIPKKKNKDNDTEYSPKLKEVLRAIQSAESKMFMWLPTLFKKNKVEIKTIKLERNRKINA